MACLGAGFAQESVRRVGWPGARPARRENQGIFPIFCVFATPPDGMHGRPKCEPIPARACGSERTVVMARRRRPRGLGQLCRGRLRSSLRSGRSLAERVGFEPTVPKGYSGFRDRPVRPLRHLSQAQNFQEPIRSGQGRQEQRGGNVFVMGLRRFLGKVYALCRVGTPLHEPVSSSVPSEKAGNKRYARFATVVAETASGTLFYRVAVE